MLSAKVGNKSCSRSEACFVCSMNYCCDHDNSYIASIVSHMSVANAGEELISCFLTFYCRDQSLLQVLNSKFIFVNNYCL